MTHDDDTSKDVSLGSRRTRHALDTPALVLDLDVLEANIAGMAAFARGCGIALRPHVKTHKSSRIARAQIAAGAIGVSCATLDEAEVMVAAGMPGVLITSPLVTRSKVARLMHLLERDGDVMVVADDPANVAMLADSARIAGRRLPVLVELDVGQRRTGVATIEDAVALARVIATAPSLRHAGLQAYAGHLQHVPTYAERARALGEVHARVSACVAALSAAGLAPAIVTGGGTGSTVVDAGTAEEPGPFTELQPGSYTVMDAEYLDIEHGPGRAMPFRPALTVQVTVVSANQPGLVTTDGGTKAFALNGPPARIVTGPLAGAAYTFAGDEHGKITLPEGAAPPRVGSTIECVVPHCDPTIALYDMFHCVRSDEVVDLWPIDARGRRTTTFAPREAPSRR